MKHDLNEVHAYWREYNEAHKPEETNIKVGITFDIREDYIELLREAGFETNEEVLEAGEDVILEINGIGASTVKKIFSYIGNSSKEV